MPHSTSKQATASETRPCTVLVVGSNPDWDEAARLARGAQQVLCYTLEGLVRIGERSGNGAEIVDVSSQIAANEAKAWCWASGVCNYLEEHASRLPAGVVQSAKRSLFMWVFWEIALAESRAAEVTRRIPDGAVLTAVGISDLERMALFGVDDEAVSKESDMERAAVHPARLASRVPVRLVGEAAERARLLFAAAKRGRRLQFGARDLSRQRGTGPCCVVVLSQRVHLRALRSTLRALSERGWCHLLLDMSVAGDVSDEMPDAFAGVAREHPFGALDGTFLDEFGRVRRHTRIARLAGQWAAANGLDAYRDSVSSGVALHVRQVQCWMRVHRVFIAYTRPDALLCANETSPVIESLARPAYDAGVPTVNVQHGVIGQTLRRAEFRFDRFCVFGPAYVETLEALGTERHRIVVTGNPFFDGAPESRAEPPPCYSSCSEERESLHEPLTILFAAAYTNDLSSDWLHYRVLGVLLDYLDLDPKCRAVVKLHPLGAGKEFGYELALSEHTGTAVEVVRDGDIHALVGEADCVTTLGSTVAFEAASLEKPVILIRPHLTDQPHPLVDEGTAMQVSDSAQFAECIDAIRHGSPVTKETYMRADARYAYRRDGLAGSRIAELCEELAQSRRAPIPYGIR